MQRDFDSALLADYTSLRVGGLADDVVAAETEQDLIDAVQSADLAGTPVLILGAGSNIVAADDGFRGQVILVKTVGYSSSADSCGGAIVNVQAGHNWDELVADAVAQSWSGLEALSGIPGTVGATPIQNVGAYGQEVGDWIYRIRTYDRFDQQIKTFTPSECGFGYRTSMFKQQPGRYVILEVSFQLRLGSHSAPVKYSELAGVLGVDVHQRANTAAVRTAVLGLRASKGMVLDPLDHDTWSVGSFFTNPILDLPAARLLPPEAPRWPQPDGSLKVSAAWLLSNAGFAAGYGLNDRATLSTKHSLAITNRGSATANDILELARHLQHGVFAKFGVQLEIEPTFVGNFA